MVSKQGPVLESCRMGWGYQEMLPEGRDTWAETEVGGGGGRGVTLVGKVDAPG